LAFPAHPQLTKLLPIYDVTELIIAIGSPNIGIPGASSINQTTAYLWRKSILINTALFSLYATVIPNPLIFCSFMLVKTHASFVIYFAIRTTSYCNKCLAFMHFSYA